ncbi:polysaccharide deacetylase family protein [Micromonospora krabiensis]|uniref:Peptidoglycan/xylan/chitin deacetylase, PgdA/CDA1 family n=1 Tax=Micromonospora krabiensis TaxID=307121 RepID=A0A1C3NBK4_9ACTN|nr:polysaccharide deacetylase family protein [Micromonospora krabiensis]SBV29929.1 Peptidoglycan/xylan/chitin deacetylase, PgdA/CDA1 family [Micromonospora krabiensis]
MSVKNLRVPLAVTLAVLAAVAALVAGPTPRQEAVSAGLARLPRTDAPTAATPGGENGAPAAGGTPGPIGGPGANGGPGTNGGPGANGASGAPGTPNAPEATPPASGPTPPGATPPGTLPPVVDHGPRTGNKVALTFDADLTDAMRRQLRTGAVRSYANLAIIDLLERRQVPATFFLTGKWVEEYPQVTRRLAGNPRFELANHTYGHAAFTPDCYDLPRIPKRSMTADVARTFDVIAPYGGRQTRYFRFPGLCHDRTALSALAPLGVTVVDGDVVSGDPFATAWRPLVRAVLSQVRPGSVIIMHVTEANAPMTDEALPHILAGLAERGLRPAPLSEVLSNGEPTP